MSQQRAPERYDQRFMLELLRRVDELESGAYRRGRDIEINVAPLASSGNRQPRLILRSPNGTRYSVVVDNAGALSTTVVP